MTSGDALAGGQNGTGPAPVRDVVVVGASAGGVEALMRFVGALPAGLAASVLVVLHVPARAPSALAAILGRQGKLPAATVGPQEPLVPGRVVVARPDHHLVVTDEGLASVHGPRESGHRPSIDVLFRTAAVHLGPRVVAVVLSGSDDDGTAGALAVRERGGLVLAQSDADALYPVMPSAVRRQVGLDAEGTAEELGVHVAREVGRVAAAPPDAGGTPPEGLRREAAVGEGRPDAVLGEPLGDPSGFACPDCSGVLFTVGEQPVLRYRCRIGHAWSADGLVDAQALTVETALWTAVRTLQERADLTSRLAHRAQDDGRHVSAEQFHRTARDARAAAGVLQQLLVSGAADEPVEQVGDGEPARA